jgi:hypothetical protein
VLKSCFPEQYKESGSFEGEFIDEESYSNELIDLDYLEGVVKQGISNYKKRCDDKINRAKIKIENGEGADL